MKTIGIIGLGSIGSRHAHNLSNLGCKVYGHDPVLVSKFPHMDPGWMMGQVDAVVIASPTPLHADQADNFMDAGIKVFVEKPIADRIHPKLQFVDMVGYNMRFHPAVKQAQQWIPVLGDIQWAHFCCAQYNDKPAYRRDGVILNWSHEIDLALHLLGPAAVKSCVADRAETMANILLEHDSGCQSTIHLDYVTKPEQRDFVVVGTKGTIKANLPYRIIARFDLNDQIVAKHSFGRSYDDDYIEEMQTFLDRIDGKETLGCTGAEGVAVLEACLAAKTLAEFP